MWWYKPLAPKEPIVLKGAWVEPLCAYMYMSSEMSGEVDHASFESQTMIKTFLASLKLYSKAPEMESMSFDKINSLEKVLTENHKISHAHTVPDTTSGRSPTDSDERHRLFASQNFSTHASTTIVSLRPMPRVCLAETQSKKKEKATGTAFFERRPRVKGIQIDPKSVSHISTNRWRLASNAIETYSAIQEHYLFHSHNQGRCLHFRSEELISHRIQNWPQDDLLRNVGGLMVGMILWLACFAYGGIHLTAWNDHFPSSAEQWLWRSSSLYIGFCGGLWILLNYVAQAYGPLNAFWEKWMDGGGRRWQNVIISAPVILCGVSLLFARAFIVVEAFISIRELPAAAYQTPGWTQVIPHF